MPKKKYKNPALTVDGIIKIEADKIVLIQRKNKPFKGKYALPGGFVDYGEKVEHALKREMREETNLEIEPTMLVGVYSDPDRDPRGHMVSVTFECKVVSGELKAGDDASNEKVVSLDQIEDMDLAFDHKEILLDYISKIKK